VIANDRVIIQLAAVRRRQELGRAAMLQEFYTMPGKKKPHPQFSPFSAWRHSFVIFGMNHPEDSFY